MPHTPPARAPATLVLTGDRHQGHYLVLVDEHPAWLSAGSFTTLCQLALARHRTTTGYAPVLPMSILRLRQALGLALGSSARGRSIIETGSSAEYRLNPEIAHIALAPSFEELPAPGLLPIDDKADLVRLLPVA